MDETPEQVDALEVIAQLRVLLDEANYQLAIERAKNRARNTDTAMG